MTRIPDLYILTRIFTILNFHYVKNINLTLKFHFMQTLNLQTEGVKKNLTFVPLAPACVVSINDFHMLI